MQYETLVHAFLHHAGNKHDVPYAHIQDGDAPDRCTTMGEIAARSRRLAAWLLDNGFAGQRAVLMFPPGLEFTEAFFACLMSGVVAVPVPPAPLIGSSKRVTRIKSILGDCEPSLVLGLGKSVEKGPEFFADDHELRNVRWVGFESAINDSSADRIVEPAPHQLAMLQYTSGSTASPKGVMLTQGNLLHNVSCWDHGWGHDDASRVVSWLPHFHDLGLLYGVLYPIWRAIPGYLLSPASVIQDPLRWLQAISTHRATHSMGPNFIYEHCVAKISDADRDALDLSSWKMALNAAEPIRAETLDRFHRKFASCGLRATTLTSGFGLAEATCQVTGQDWDQLILRLRLSTGALARGLVAEATDTEEATVAIGCGTPAIGTLVKIVNPETLAEAEPDRVGEIWVHSDSVAQGYWNRPEQSELTFGATIAGDTQQRTYMRTGDLGFMSRGEVFTTGRIKDLIIVRGENYYPQDAEWRIETAHPAFKPSCCAVFSVERDGEERIAVVQELVRHANRWPQEELFAVIRREIATVWDLPIESIVLTAPGTSFKTSSGKIQRSRTRAAWLDDALQVVARWDRHTTQAAECAAAAGTDIADIRAHLMQRVSTLSTLPASAIDASRPIAEYGLGSLEATTLAQELSKRYRVEVPPTAVYDYPSIDKLAGYVAAGIGRRPDMPSVPAQAALADDTVVVVGMACRFPGAPDVDAFWQLLMEGRSGTSRCTLRDGSERLGRFLGDTATFDNEFFSITRREAACLDPQQRIALEVSWQALEDAGIRPSSLAGSATGVFFGSSGFDYGSLQLSEGALDSYSAQGSVLAVIANRIAYQYDLAGPSFVVDTACSSALTAVHLACRSLREGESDLAIAGAVNLLIAEDWDIALRKAGMLSPDGACKTFDARADGYTRGEGCGIVVLKRYADAVSDGDRIYGAIMGSAVNQNGRSNGLTAPNGNAQERLLRVALAAAKVDSADVGYVEAHGTGTSLGDPIECAALRRVLGGVARECRIGSVKANIGHLEAAAGMAGLIKTLLAIEQGIIPPQIHFDRLNPLIELGDSLSVPSEASTWQRNRKSTRRAIVSAFGFAGSNACVVVGDVQSPAADAPLPDTLPFSLSARTIPALQRLAARYASHMAQADAGQWPRIAYTSTCRRDAQAVRFSAPASHPGELAARLAALVRGEVADLAPASKAPRVAFLFSGQGIPLAGAARELQEQLPAFHEAMQSCGVLLQRILGIDLNAVLYENAADLSRPSIAQPVQLALQYALAHACMAFGIQPHVVLGHSLGEYPAWVITGAMSLETALQLVAIRGKLSEDHCGSGAMVAVFTDEARARQAIASSGAAVELAVVNSHSSCVVAGAPEAVAHFCLHLADHGVAHRVLRVARAYHTASVEPAVEPLRRAAFRHELRAPTIPVISSVTGQRWPEDRPLTAQYLATQLRQPVRFLDALHTLALESVDIAIEIGSQDVLCEFGRKGPGATATRWVPVQRAATGGWAAFLACLGQAFMQGVDVQWDKLFAGHSLLPVRLPPYAFEPERHWFRPREQARCEPAPHREMVPIPIEEVPPMPQPAACPLRDVSISDKLVQILSDLLSCTPADIDTTQSFFNFGADSIILMEFIRILQQEYRQEFTVSDLFEHYSSVELLAGRLEALDNGVEHEAGQARGVMEGAV
ncbi:MAG TPA: beta-ketoacyl synthase N-terminal-like domain-containing protein [Burkholderiaceae bacterium]|nr:beta-ketoacyl synthase N-terminal-like domain-containing protein [Burkholderiaceae bacterium]